MDTAVALARAAIGAEPDLPAEAHPVRRLDRDASYVLVRLGNSGEPGWLAAVDTAGREVMTWAMNRTGRSTIPDRPQLAGAATNSELVWQPGMQSRSPLYPLLRLKTDQGALYVDLSGAVWSTLTEGRG